MGATASLKSTRGNTAAGLAAKNGHDTVVKLLQKRGGLGLALRSGVNRPSMLGVAVTGNEATSSGSGDGSGKLILDAVDGLPSDLDSLLSSPASSVGSSSKRAFLFRQLGSSDRKLRSHGASGASGARGKDAGGSSGGARPPFEDSLSAVLPSAGFKRRNEHA